MRRWLWVALTVLLVAPGAVWGQQGAVVQATPQGGAPDGSQPYVQQTPYHALRVQLNLGGVDIGLGQQTKAGSIPVVLPSDQTVAVSGSFSATPVITTPATQAGGTVGTGGTFQTPLAANSSRTGCTLQNTSTHTGYVYWLATGSATLLNSFQLPPGATFYCGSPGGGVIKTAIQYTTGTATDPFNVTENN